MPWLVAFAGIGVIADQILHKPNSLQLLNSVIVIAWFLLLLVALYRNHTAENLRVVRASAIVLVGAVLITNVLPLYSGILPPVLDYLEPIAFTGFLASLGAVVVRRLFQNEEQLIALNKELDVARKIQASILPRETPQSPLVSFATRYLSMTAVAGDFYDFLVVDENHFGVLIADVSGHGVPAALGASMVKIAVSAQLPHAADPALVLAGMNRILCGKMQNQFVTAAYLFLDLEKSDLHYGAAGHPPLLCRDSQDIFDSVTENGLMLGLFPAASYTSTRRPLSKGSRLLLYTDGLLEASDSHGQFFGEEQVRQTTRCQSAAGRGLRDAARRPSPSMDRQSPGRRSHPHRHRHPFVIAVCYRVCYRRLRRRCLDCSVVLGSPFGSLRYPHTRFCTIAPTTTSDEARLPSASLTASSSFTFVRVNWRPRIRTARL